MISHEHKMIFIPVPRCGSTAVLKAFGSDLRGGHPIWGHYAAKYPREWRTYLKWAPIRNPWDRLRSCYNYARMESSFWHPKRAGTHPDKHACDNHTLESLLQLRMFPHAFRHEGWRPQAEWWYGGDEIKLVPLAHIGDFCQAEFGVEVPYVNASTQEQHEFTPAMNDVVRAVYPIDIEAFGRASRELCLDVVAYVKTQWGLQESKQ